MFVLNSTLKTLVLCKIAEQLEKLYVVPFSGNILLYDGSSSSFKVIDSHSVALFGVNRFIDEAKGSKVSIKVIQNSNRDDLYKISARIGTEVVVNYIDQNQNLISKEWFDVGYNFDEFGIAIVGKKREAIDGFSDGSCYYSLIKRDGTFLGPTNLLGVTPSTISRKFGFFIVQLSNGNFNYVNIKTGELLLPETTKITRAGNFNKEEGVVLARIEQYGKIGQQYVDLNGKIWNSKEDAKAGI